MLSRFRQADREARITLWVYAAFFVWWTVGAFGLGPWAEVTIWGLPAWFVVSSVLSYPLVCVGLWLVLRYSFRHMPLSSGGGADDENEADAVAARPVVEKDHRS